MLELFSCTIRSTFSFVALFILLIFFILFQAHISKACSLAAYCWPSDMSVAGGLWDCSEFLFLF